MDSLIQYRLTSAHEKLESAKVLLDAQLFKDSVGRSYYAIFSALRAVLAMKQVDFSKHAGVGMCYIALKSRSRENENGNSL